ncbi:MAG: hypothetical protein AB8F74_08870 [Saprospiraceae bacterium]
MKITHFFALILVNLILILSSSCVSLSGFQTGKTLEKNQVALSASANVMGVGEGDGGIPLLEVGVRYGVVEKLDLGLRMSNFGAALFDLKYQLAGDKESKTAFAIGAGVGSALLRVETDDDRNGANFNLHVPLYASYHPKENLSLYLSPRYIYFNDDVFDITVTDNAASSFFGGNVGVLFGKDFQFGVDAGFFGTDRNDFIFQIGIGVVGKI